MMTFFKSFQSGEQQAIPMYNRISLTRSFVETGDERCPLAGIWSRLPETDSAVDDEPGLPGPSGECSCSERFLSGHLVFVSSPIHKFAIPY